MALAAALDLGSTRVKAASLGDDGKLVVVGTRPAPPVSGHGLIREADPQGYLDGATALLRLLAACAPGAPVGLACQRSSFVIWERATGNPVTPLVSWQDRRAEPWCAARSGLADGLAEATGLVLSPHYAGPKLAFMLAAEPALASGMAAGELLFGTLDTFLLWNWSGGRAHRVDLSMAARTMLVPFGGTDWDPRLLKTFGVPRAALPAIGPSAAPLDLGHGIRVAATLADQAAAMRAVSAGPDTALVNLGTGGFVMLPAGARRRAPRGFLGGPLTGVGGGGALRSGALALEGTINAIGPALEALGEGPTVLPDADPAPDAFCLPDSAGVGAPHWRAAPPRRWSERAAALPDAERRRVFLEGVVFRVREIVEGMAPRRRPHALVLAGGMAEEPFIGPALAACTGLAVARLAEPEATLLGAARLAAGLPPGGAGTEPVAAQGGAYLADKYGRWRAWVRAAPAG